MRINEKHTHINSRRSHKKWKWFILSHYIFGSLQIKYGNSRSKLCCHACRASQSAISSNINVFAAATVASSLKSQSNRDDDEEKVMRMGDLPPSDKYNPIDANSTLSTRLRAKYASIVSTMVNNPYKSRYECLFSCFIWPISSRIFRSCSSNEVKVCC